jgi:hypothetical protein
MKSAHWSRWMRERGIRQPHLLAQLGDSAAQRFLQLFEDAWQAPDAPRLPRPLCWTALKKGESPPPLKR